MSKTSSQRACLAPTRRVMYLFLRKVNLPCSLIRPPGQSRYSTGVWLSSSASVPYTPPVSESILDIGLGYLGSVHALGPPVKLEGVR